MSFATFDLPIVRPLRTKVLAHLLLTSLLVGLSVCLGGCSDGVRLSSAEQLAEFERARPLRRAVDVDRLVRAKIGGGPYRVVTGDALELTMPSLLQAASPEEVRDRQEETVSAVPSVQMTA